jgi:hypothetical protein
LLKWLFIGFGGISLLAGLLTFWLPLPIGVPLMLLGLTLLVRYSPHAREQLARLVLRYPRHLGFLSRLLHHGGRVPRDR